jgi:hypothetical protein
MRCLRTHTVIFYLCQSTTRKFRLKVVVDWLLFMQAHGMVQLPFTVDLICQMLIHTCAHTHVQARKLWSRGFTRTSGTIKLQNN